MRYPVETRNFASLHSLSEMCNIYCQISSTSIFIAKKQIYFYYSTQLRKTVNPNFRLFVNYPHPRADWNC